MDDERCLVTTNWNLPQPPAHSLRCKSAICSWNLDASRQLLLCRAAKFKYSDMPLTNEDNVSTRRPLWRVLRSTNIFLAKFCTRHLYFGDH